MQSENSNKAPFADLAVKAFITFDDYQGKPDGLADRALEDFCVSANFQCRKFEVDPVGDAGSDLVTDITGSHQHGKGKAGLDGACVPNNDVRPIGAEQSLIAPKSGHLAPEVLKGSEVPAADDGEDLCGHGDDAAVGGSAGQDGKEDAA